MINSPSDLNAGSRSFRGVRAGKVICVGVILAFAGWQPASAQTGNTGQPLRLAPLAPQAQPQGVEDEGTQPRTDEPSGGLPSLVLPAPGSDSLEGTAQPGLSDDVVPQGIEINPLAELDPDSLGTLDPDSGGLGLDLWQGSDRALIETLLKVLPATSSSPTMRNLAIRLLLSNARAPLAKQELEGGATPEDPENEAPLLRARIDRLFAMGAIEDLRSLFNVVPQRYDSDAVAQTRVNADLLAGDDDVACRLVRNNIAIYPQSAFWPKALIYCQFLAGETTQATLGIDLLREGSAEEDPVFQTLANFLMGGEARPFEAQQIEPLHFAMMRFAKYPEPPLSAAGAAVWLQTAIATWEAAPRDLRAEASEAAVAAGALDPGVLAEVYGEFIFTEEQRAAALTTATTLPPTEGRALLYQVARDQPVESARAEVVRVALDHGRDNGGYAALMPVMLPMIVPLRPSSDLSWFAETAGRALYLSGQPDDAARWYFLAANRGTAAAQNFNALWPYSRLTGAAVQPRSYSLADWGRVALEREGTDPAAVIESQALLLTAFRALGEHDPMAWSDVVRGGADEARSLGGAPLLFALQEAAQAGRRGEAIALALVLLGEEGPADGHPVALAAALGALAQVDLATDARALAMEAAAARGV